LMQQILSPPQSSTYSITGSTLLLQPKSSINPYPTASLQKN
jgi:hypothetical protein